MVTEKTTRNKKEKQMVRGFAPPPEEALMDRRRPL
jgi:hypothetical protein